MEPPSANSFHAFSRLPPELRCRIWQFAAFPRILTLRQRPWHVQLRENDNYFFSYDSVPAVMHTCHESRIWAPYVRAFRNVVGSGLIDSGGSARYIWVNFELDTVRFVDQAIDFGKLSNKDSAALQHIILQYAEVHNFFCDIMLEMNRMKSLKSLQIHIAYGGLRWWWEEIDWLEVQFDKWFGQNEQWVCPKILLRDLDTGFQLDRDNYRTHWRLAPNSPIRCPRAAPQHIRGYPVLRGFRGGRSWRSKRAQQPRWLRLG